MSQSVQVSITPYPIDEKVVEDIVYALGSPDIEDGDIWDEDASFGIWHIPLPEDLEEILEYDGYLEVSATVDGVTYSILAEMP